ncbi:MAG: methyltransferase domain-containing protein [Candidatus Eisenbacteria bacterium]|nr:methyltransferase domain-containing protein [Candidatus Eisenbacteria bacterium]
MTGYYAEKLSGERLERCYQVASPRVRRYLDSELQHALETVASGHRVLDLGCGYGRTLPAVADRAGAVVGIDSSFGNLSHGAPRLVSLSNCRLAAMDAARLAFPDAAFDRVLCLQNGISAFHVDQRELLCEALRVTRPGGLALFSSYAERFWEDRLEWFRRQAAAGLLGEIDEEATGGGVIVCRDGFRATTVTPDRFRRLAQGLAADLQVREVDGSSVFCELRRRTSRDSPPGS